MKQLDLTNPIHAYIFGFIQGDGSVDFNEKLKNYRVSIEIKSSDAHLLSSIKNELNVNGNIIHRKNRNTCSLYICSKSFVKNIISLGVPPGKKSKVVSPPIILMNDFDYWRGIIDADGSIGFFQSGRPFVGLTTSSFELGFRFIQFANKVTGKEKSLNNCLVDDIFRITYYCEDAQVLCEALYYDQHPLSLERKKENARSVKNWKRTFAKKPLWTKSELSFIKTHAVKESAVKLNRSEKAIREKLRRLGISAKSLSNYR